MPETLTPRGLLVTTAALAVFLCVLTGLSRAQEFGDFGVGHEEYHHFYNHGENGGPLMRPYGDPNIKCCDGDCRPTKARQKDDGSWEVWLDRRWWPVPPERIKTNVANPTTLAHACASRSYDNIAPAIFCFVPPEPET